MDEMNMFNLLTVSAPEAVLDLFLGFLIIGCGKYLRPSKENVLRLLATVAAMVTASFVIRSFVVVGVLSILAHVTVYTIIIKFIYNVGWKKALSGVTFFVVILMTLELIYLGPVMAYLQSNLSDVLSNNMLRLVCSIPERLIQFGIIVSIWNSEVVWVDLKEYGKVQNVCNSVLSMLYLGESIFLFTYIQKIDKMDLYLQFIYFIGCMLFVSVNVLMLKAITLLTAAVKEKEEFAYTERTQKMSAVLSKLKGLL